MSDIKDQGPAAFPSVNEVRCGDYITGGHRGMALRDYFAAKAMVAMVNLCKDDGRAEGLSYPEHIAAVSYGMADAMLKARGE